MLTSLDQNESKFFLTCTNWNSQSWAMRNDITNKTENMSSKLQYGMHLVACRERRQMRNYDPALDDQLGIPWKTVATAFVVVCGWSVLPMPSFTTSQLRHTAAGESVSVCQWSIPPLDQLTWTTWHYDLSLRLTSSRGQPGTTYQHCRSPDVSRNDTFHSPPINGSILAIMAGCISDHWMLIEFHKLIIDYQKFEFNIPDRKHMN